MKKEIPVLLLTGYLGSGKTTLLNRILSNGEGIRFAVIVNDIGEVNIDETLIRKEGIVGQSDDADLVALQNGCICCTLRTDLIDQISQLTDSGLFDYIVIEASGICEPEPIARTIAGFPSYDEKYHRNGMPVLDCIVTVVDALRLKSEFESGDALDKQKIGEEDIENLIIQQIEFCNLILLNKISEVTPEDAARIKAVVRALQPKARIIECDYCDVPLGKLLHTHLFDYEDVATSATWVSELEKPVDEEHHHDHEHEHDHDHGHHHEHEHHHDHDHEHEHDHHHDHDAEHCPDPEHCCCHHHHHHHGEGEAEEYGIGTFVYYRRRPFDLNKFDWFVAKKWPASVIRAKGVVYFKENPNMSYLFEQAGVQKQLTEAGYWYATAPEEEQRSFREADPNLERDWDPEYGDRMEKIVFIGRDMDKKEICSLLDSCLTDLTL